MSHLRLIKLIDHNTGRASTVTPNEPLVVAVAADLLDENWNYAIRTFRNKIINPGLLKKKTAYYPFVVDAIHPGMGPRLISTSFKCAYVRGRGGPMFTMGDSGSFISEANGRAEALDYVFEDGTTNEKALETTWVIDLLVLCRHLREKTGQTCKVWTWTAEGEGEEVRKEHHGD